MENDKLKIIINELLSKNKTVSVMESCTGGRISDAITNIEGASGVFRFGAVTYSNEYKIKLGVASSLIECYSVYSPQVAREMSKKISDFTVSDYGIGVTGKLNCEDRKNPEGKNDIVYVSVYNKSKNNFVDFYVQVDSEDRDKNKDIVLKKIISVLYRIVY